ncbi:MAG: YbjQ family protein [Verrucomicrobiota bacterium]
MKYDIELNDGSWLNALTEQEVAEQIKAEVASVNGDCRENGSSRINSIRRTIPGIVSLVERTVLGPKTPVRDIMLTTEQAPSGFVIIERKEIITAECAFGMNFFIDMFAGVRDVFGGRSKSTQGILRKSRKTVLDELKLEAREVGANAVIGVSLNYSEFSGQGKSMIFIVASGTAVVVEPNA